MAHTCTRPRQSLLTPRPTATPPNVCPPAASCAARGALTWERVAPTCHTSSPQQWGHHTQPASLQHAMGSGAPPTVRKEERNGPCE
eukprot:711136-Pelagomonas_calceolata.AAC.5